MENLTSLEQIFYDTFVGPIGRWTIIVLIPLFTGIVASFIIEGINSVTSPETKGIALSWIVPILLGVLNWFLFPNFVPDIPFKILMLALNVCFTFGFYHTFGKKIVEGVTAKYLGFLKIDQKYIQENKE